MNQQSSTQTALGVAAGLWGWPFRPVLPRILRMVRSRRGAPGTRRRNTAIPAVAGEGAPAGIGALQPERVGVTVCVVTAFAALAATGLFYHEMWRDELEIWLITRDSPTLGALFENMGSQGHPSLWYLVNFALSRLTRAPQAMQVLSLAIGVAAVWIFHRHAPFSRLHRTLFCFGYFPLYSYTVISRSYGLEFLLVWTACALFPQRWERPLPWAVALALLAKTHLLGAILAVGLALVPVFEAWGEGQGRARLRCLPVWSGLLLVAAMAALTVVHVALQAAEMGEAHLAGYEPAYNLAWVAKVLATVTRGFIPLPDPLEPALWGTDLMQCEAVPLPLAVTGAIVGGTAIPVLATLVLRSRRAAMLGYVVTTLAMLVVFGTVWYGALRHHGQLFLAFVAFAWIARRLPASTRRPSAHGRFAIGIARWAATPVLLVHVAAATALLYADIHAPFSPARDAARWIGRELSPNTILVASRGYAGMAISAWLDRPVYYPSIEEWGTFFDWSKWDHVATRDEVEAAAIDLHRRYRRPVLLVLSYPGRDLALGADESLAGSLRIRHVARFDDTLVRSSRYWLYLLSE